MNNETTKGNQPTGSPKEYIDQYEYFWGKVISICKDDKGELTGLLEVAALDGRKMQLEEYNFKPRRFVETVKAYCAVADEMNVDDRALFCLHGPYQKDELGANAQHVIFGWATLGKLKSDTCRQIRC